MKIQLHGKMTRFEDVQDGALLVACIGSTHVVRGIKGFWTGDNGDRQEFLISVGPFVPSDGEHPVVYHGDGVRPEWVVELSPDHVLVPSLDPKYIMDGLPDGAGAFGAIVLGAEGGTYLTAEYSRTAVRGDPRLWDLKTGEMGSLGSQAFFSTSHWTLVQEHGGGRVTELFEFPPPSLAQPPNEGPEGEGDA